MTRDTYRTLTRHTADAEPVDFRQLPPPPEYYEPWDESREFAAILWLFLIVFAAGLGIGLYLAATKAWGIL